eukprot:1554848-Rhodomonas_salina.1
MDVSPAVWQVAGHTNVLRTRALVPRVELEHETLTTSTTRRHTQYSLARFNVQLVTFNFNVTVQRLAVLGATVDLSSNPGT